MKRRVFTHDHTHSYQLLLKNKAKDICFQYHTPLTTFINTNYQLNGSSVMISKPSPNDTQTRGGPMVRFIFTANNPGWKFGLKTSYKVINILKYSTKPEFSLDTAAQNIKQLKELEVHAKNKAKKGEFDTTYSIKSEFSPLQQTICIYFFEIERY